MKLTQLQYIFDPLCGWCYASAPALAGLAATYPGKLELLPSGLFAKDGARDLTQAWANYAWSNDQRIASMTGSPFSESYRQNILRTGLRFDSEMMSRALTAVRSIDKSMEPRLLHQLQVARYVDGLDTSAADVVARVSAATLIEAGNTLNPAEFSQRLLEDTALAQETDARVRAAQLLTRQLGLAGVPLLLVGSGNSIRALSGEVLYRGAETLLAAIGRLTDGAPQTSV